jgi:hypothetical protein
MPVVTLLRAASLAVASGKRLAIPRLKDGTHMKNILIFSLLVAGAVACGGDAGSNASQNQKEFETVQEGSASGVTASLNGPGENLPPITGTNADTTTAFGIDPNAAAAPSPSTVAGTPAPAPLYPGTTPPVSAGMAPPPMTSNAPAEEPRRPTYSAPARVETPRPVEPSPDPAVKPTPAPAPTDTATAPPPAQTDTASTVEKAKKADESAEPETPETDTDTTTTEEPPPPPPPSL